MNDYQVQSIMSQQNILSNCLPHLENIKSFLGKLTFMHPSSKSIRYSTALLLCETLIITPAHNVYDRQTNTKYTNFQFALSKGQRYKAKGQCMMDDYSNIMNQKESKLYDYALLQLEKPVQIGKSLCQSLLEKDQKYAKLKYAIKDKEAYVLQQRKQMKALKAQLQNYRSAIQRYKYQGNNFKEQIQSLTRVNRHLLDEIKSLRGNLDSSTKPNLNISLSSINQSMIVPADQSMSLIRTLNTNLEASFDWDLHNPLLQQCYIVKNDRIKCKKAYERSLRVLTCQPLPERSKLRFKLIFANQNSYITFGVVSQNKLHPQSKNNEVVSYCLSNHNACCNIWMEQKKKFSNESCFFLKKNQTISMEVDMIGLTIKFKKGTKAATLPLNQTLKGKQLYPFVRLWEKGDQVQLISVPLPQ